ncbi:integral membrane protein [Lentzea sp. NBRC 105346]|uniref:DoxX family protein n=1 Tax=Lentzea sp. NBRC 105346 TaxID=3032205 RepID=UPI0024A48322|nr:DoxX family protein [Lentzea sp. NBRC 105346]GLZ32675.1 integral membrane protein [Lentzea sp. NBRC 105346]
MTVRFFENQRDHALALFRIVVGFLFVCHGAQKIFGVFTAKPPVSLTAWPVGPAGLIELVGGSLVLIGLATRWAALLSSGSMAFAYFSVHQPQALFPIVNQGELAAIYSFAFLLIAFTGAGAWSVDRLLSARKAPHRQTQPA